MNQADGARNLARLAREARSVRHLPYVLGGGVLLVLVAVRSVGVLKPTSAAFDAVSIIAFTTFNVLAVSQLFRAARSRDIESGERRAWRFIAWGVLVGAICGTIYGVSTNVGMALADPLILVDAVGRVGTTAFLLAGLLLITAEPFDRRVRLKLVLDCGTVLGGGTMILWYALVGPALTEGRPGTVVHIVAVAWPLLDLVLLVGVGAVLLRGAAGEIRRPLLLFLAGTVTNLATDLGLLYVTLRAPGATDMGPAAYVGLVALGLMAAAGRERCLQARSAEAADALRPLRPHPSVPYLALLLGYGILAVAAVRSSLYPWAGLVIGAVVMTAATAARQAIVVSENRELSATDQLTGLSNRLPLWGAIERATARSRRSGTPMAVLLLDLDGFKQVNDRYGHEAGDAMLVAFAAVLVDNVRTTDVVCRLGGDEFAVVLEDVTGRRSITVAERVHEQSSVPVPLGHRGPAGGLPIRCSIGIAVGDPLHPDGIPEPQELLHRADTAMYRSKQSGQHGWWLHDASNPSVAEWPPPRSTAAP